MLIDGTIKNYHYFKQEQPILIKYSQVNVQGVEDHSLGPHLFLLALPLD